MECPPVSGGRQPCRFVPGEAASLGQARFGGAAPPVLILPDPAQVGTSLYQFLRGEGRAPTRAIQRVGAINLSPREAQLLAMPPGAAVLRIDRTAYLPSGRPIEFTKGLYRSDLYDFIAELRLGD